MRLHLFLSRVALICNLLFVYCWLVTKTRDFIGIANVNNVIITLGWVVAPLLNVAMAISSLVFLLGKKPAATPKWLMLVNFFFLVLEIIIISTH